MSKKRYIHYDPIVEQYNKLGPVNLGIHSSHCWRADPKHLGIMLARYKFAAKMLSGYHNVLEIGCGDGFATSIVLQEAGHVHGIDVDEGFIDHCRKERRNSRSSWQVWNLCNKPLPVKFDAAYAIDVFEHIPKRMESRFLRNLVSSMKPRGICLIGLPSVESQKYASRYSRVTHVNCKTATELKNCMRKFFKHVFIFSMNDEVVHTGFYSMAHYLWALCVL